MSQSIEATVSGGLAGVGEASTTVGMEFSQEVVNSTSHTSEFSKSVEKTYNFTVPAGKLYTIKQLRGSFIDKLGDSFGFKGTQLEISETS